MLIYKATNTVNGKSYIGQTINPLNVDAYSKILKPLKKRWKRHCRDAKSTQYPNLKFYRAIRKYGPEVFMFEALDNVPDNMADYVEIYWIALYDTYNHGYNSTIGGDGGKTLDVYPKGKDHPLYGKRLSETTEFKKGVHPSETTEFKKGIPSWNKGKPMSYVHGMSGKAHSEETKKKMRLARLGKPLSEETIEKMKGRTPWNKGKTGLQKAWNKGMSYSVNGGHRQ